MSEPRIFCAVDTADIDAATELARQVGPVTKGLKLGLEFFGRHGPQGVEKVREACPEAALFLDLKFHDIPNTVAGAVKTVSSNLGPEILNVHASGGFEMMRAAKDACAPASKLIAVTILTSLDGEQLQKIGYEKGETEHVTQLALLTREAGLDGVVCSSHEIEALRAACGPDFLLVVPGIRPKGADVQDQKRVMSPEEAVTLGANHLVIGRPITQAPDPAKAAQDILEGLDA